MKLLASKKCLSFDCDQLDNVNEVIDTIKKSNSYTGVMRFYMLKQKMINKISIIKKTYLVLITTTEHCTNHRGSARSLDSIKKKKKNIEKVFYINIYRLY